MSDKSKWAGIYLLFSAIPFFFYLGWNSFHDMTLPSGVIPFLVFVPYVGLSLVAILGWKINQTRIFWSTLLLLAVFFYLHHSLLDPKQWAASEERWKTNLQIIGAAYPLSLCIIYLLKESRLWSDTSLARFLLSLSPLVFFMCLHGFTRDLYQNVMFWEPFTPLASAAQVSSFPKLAWVNIGFFLLIVFYLYDPKVKSFLAALATTFALFAFSLWVCLQGGLFDPDHRTFFTLVASFSVATLILLHALLRMYWQKVYLDPLTAVSNRQALDERLHTLNGDFSLAMVDIDHFKKFNDTYGHAEGDHVLRMLAQHLQENLGEDVYRYGGEEFCVVFDKKRNSQSFEMMEKARATLAKRKFVLRAERKPGYSHIPSLFRKKEGRGRRVSVTMSVGVASTDKNHRTAEEVIKRADHALYEAKEKGRNRVVTAG